jgi:glucose/arabinose dehydrogenase
LATRTGGSPDFGVNSGDPRFMYIGEQNGAIRILDFNQANPVSATNFLSLDSVLGADSNGNRVLVDDTGLGERGLVGSAFSPDFNNPGTAGYRKFYTFTSETLASAGANPFIFRNPLEPTASGNNNSNDPVQSGIPNGYNCQSVIREWTVNDPNANGLLTVNTSLPSRVVMRIAKPGRFHNGGGITFGGDGYMYIPLGDGGGGPSNGGNDGGNNSLDNGHTNPGNPDSPGAWTGQGNAQDRRVVYGKILRIKPTIDTTDGNLTTTLSANGQYRIPNSNPFTTAATDPNGNFVDEIYAYGFRNPFRISFDKADPSKLYAADVGQDRNSFSHEEIDSIVSGGNYGWVAKSGTSANTNEAGYTTSIPLIDPIAQYDTTQIGTGGLAAIGGFVYRGSLIPGLNGKYVFADLDKGDGTGGRLLYTDPSEPALTVFDLNISGAVQKPAGAVLIHGVAQDANGEIYFLFDNGQVMELVPEPATWALALIGAAVIGWQIRHQQQA